MRSDAIIKGYGYNSSQTRKKTSSVIRNLSLLLLFSDLIRRLGALICSFSVRVQNSPSVLTLISSTLQLHFPSIANHSKKRLELMEHFGDTMLQEHSQPPQQNKCIPHLSKSTIEVLGFFNIVYWIYLNPVQNAWKVCCIFWLYMISVLLLISNGKIQDFSMNRVGKVHKWRRVCTLLLCLLVSVLPASIYYDHMEHWFKISIFVGSGILIVIILVLHVAIVDLSKLKGNIVTEPKFIDLIMYYNILNTLPFCAVFTFRMMGDPWSLWWDALICTLIILVAVCNSKAVVLHRRAEFMKWRRAASFGMAMLPVLAIMYQYPLQESSKMVSWIMDGNVFLLVVLSHIIKYEMKTGKEDGESEKKSA